MKMLKLIVASVFADVGLFAIDPQFGAMGAVIVILLLFIASFF